MATLDRAFAILGRRLPGPVQRAHGALTTLSPALAPVDPPPAWSSLTADGSPVELTFSSGGRAVRYTTEVQGLGADSAGALDEAERRLGAIGAAALSPPLAARLRTIQRGGPLTYGAWIGGRHDADGDRYKIYVEVPRPAPDEAAALVHDLVGGSGLYGRHPLRMIGHELSSGITELYFRAEELAPWELLLLAEESGRPADEIRALVEELAGRAVGEVFPGVWGLSVAVASTGWIRAITLFTFARTLIGPDPAVRRRLLAVAGRRGWDLADYADVTHPLARAGCGASHHGMVALVLVDGAPIEIRIGLSPPPMACPQRPLWIPLALQEAR